jgi:hypothetical protein
MGEKWPRNFAESGDFHITFGFFYMPFYGFTSTPKESVLRVFSPRKIRRLLPGLTPRTWVPKASTLPLDHRSRYKNSLGSVIMIHKIYFYFAYFYL